MPRASKGARLWLRPASKSRESVWIIRDGAKWVSTGCGPRNRREAETQLAEYIIERHTADRTRDRRASEVEIADVIAIWLTDRVPLLVRPHEYAQRAGALLDFWGDKKLDYVNGANCRAYVKQRMAQPWKSARPEQTNKPPRMISEGGPRRELEDLRAAINYHHKEGLCRDIIEVSLPEKAPAREVWLTRSQAAVLLWACWRAKDKLTGRPMAQHVARFILVGLYTGTRASAICGAAIEPTPGRGYVNLDRGVFYRRAAGERDKKRKRKPPARLSRRLMAHLRRWKEKGISAEYIVEWNGKPVLSVRKGFGTARKAAGLGPEITPHALRHTAATWLMQAGADIWRAAGLLGMSAEMLDRTYGHHHPDYQKEEAELLSGTQKRHRLSETKREHAVPNVINISDKSRALP